MCKQVRFLCLFAKKRQQFYIFLKNWDNLFHFSFGASILNFISLPRSLLIPSCLCNSVMLIAERVELYVWRGYVKISVNLWNSNTHVWFPRKFYHHLIFYQVNSFLILCSKFELHSSTIMPRKMLCLVAKKMLEKQSYLYSVVLCLVAPEVSENNLCWPRNRYWKWEIASCESLERRWNEKRMREEFVSVNLLSWSYSITASLFFLLLICLCSLLSC